MQTVKLHVPSGGAEPGVLKHLRAFFRMIPAHLALHAFAAVFVLLASAPRTVRAQLAPVTVKVGEQVQSVAVIQHPEGGAAVRADQLAAALGGQLTGSSSDHMRYSFEVGATGLDLEAGSSLALLAGDTIPLTATAFRRGNMLFVPLTLAVEVLPRIGAGVLYDAGKHEIRRFTPVVASRAGGSSGSTVRSSARTAPAQGSTGPTTVRTGSSSVGSGARDVRARTVIVDAGHGGPDPGMTGPIGATRKITEKSITLALSKELAAALQSRGIKVVMTRTTDTLIALRDRGRIANQAKGDLFVSVHVNSANPTWNNPGGARGFETYFLAEAKTEDERRVAAMENEAIKFETAADASRDDPLGFIIRDMAQNEHLRESARLAQLIQGGLKTIHPGTDRGVKQAGFAVLVTAFMPAVLVEVGFGSNKLDSAFMTDPAKQVSIANSLADAIVKYLDEYDRKVNSL